MADKTVTVRLRAVVAEYQAAMGKAAASTAAVSKSGKGLTSLGPETAKLGGQLTRNVTLPILAIGAAAGKMSYDFEATFARMQGLAGVAAEDIDGLKQSVLDLAGETGRAPGELAEGLYFVESAGIKGATAMEALETSAKGATAGLGSTAAVADAVTSAINAYGEANITAAQAGDVLAATAREGKAEAAALAPQFGRLLPIAAELGVSFDEVGAGMAFLSRSSGDAALSATQLNGVLEKMLNPSEEGADALARIGSSAAELRQSVADNGLLPTLTDLRNNLEANGLTMADFSRDNQFLQGALQLTGVQADEAKQVFASLADSSGSLGTAFGAVAETDGFKMKQALAEVQVALIKLGDVILPLAATVASFGAGAVTALSSLPGPIDSIVVGFLAMAMAIGPLLKIAGPLVAAYRKVGEVVTTVGSGFGATAGQMSGWKGSALKGAAALGIMTAALEMYQATMAEAEEQGKHSTDGIREQFEGLDPAKTSMSDLKDIIAGLNGDITDMSNTKRGSNAPWDADFRKELGASIDASKGLRGEWTDLMYAAQALARETGVSEDAALRQILANEELAASVDPVTGAFDAEAGATIAATQALQDHADALRAQYDPLFAMQDALQAEADAHAAVTAAVKDHGAGSAEATQAEQDLFRAVVDSDGAALSLAAAMEASGASTDDMRGQLDGWVASGRLTKKQADEIAWSLGIARGKGLEYADRYTADLAVNDHASPQIEAAIARLGRFSGTFVANLLTFGGHHGAESGGLVKRAGMPKPGPTDTIPMMLAPGEFVVDAANTRRLGVPYLTALNGGADPGGAVAVRSDARPQLASVGGQTIVHHHEYRIYASSIDAHSIGRTVRDGLEAGGRRGVAA